MVVNHDFILLTAPETIGILDLLELTSFTSALTSLHRFEIWPSCDHDRCCSLPPTCSMANGLGSRGTSATARVELVVLIESSVAATGNAVALLLDEVLSRCLESAKTSLYCVDRDRDDGQIEAVKLELETRRKGWVYMRSRFSLVF